MCVIIDPCPHGQFVASRCHTCNNMKISALRSRIESQDREITELKRSLHNSELLRDAQAHEVHELKRRLKRWENAPVAIVTAMGTGVAACNMINTCLATGTKLYARPTEE